MDTKTVEKLEKHYAKKADLRAFDRYGKAWSYSKHNSVHGEQGCPFRQAVMSLFGIKEPESPAMRRGNEIHAHVEAYLNGEVDELDTESWVKKGKPAWEGWEDYVDDLWNQGYEAERQLGFTVDWSLTGYWDEDIWFRIKADATKVRLEEAACHTIDWKSGNFYPEAEDQGELSALVQFMEHEDLEYVEVDFCYVDVPLLRTGEIDEENAIKTFDYVRGDDLQWLLEKWTAAGKAITEKKMWLKNPGRACRAYGKPCPLAKSEGGPCNHG